MRIPAVVGSLIASVSLLLPLQSFAATRTWDGEGSNLKWNNPVNWSSNTVPGWADTAVFDGTSTKNVDIGTGAVVNALQIRNGYTGTLRTVTGASVYIGTGSWLQQAGTFHSGTGMITVRGSLTLTGGTLIASPRFTTVTGDFNHTGGTFTHNDGTLTLASPSARAVTTSATLSTLNTESTLETGLEAYWKLDEDPAATNLGGFFSNQTQRTTIYDYTGHGWDMQMPALAWTSRANWPAYTTDAAPTAFANPGSFVFKQSRSWLNQIYGPSIGATGSISFWLKIVDFNHAYYETPLLFCTHATVGAQNPHQFCAGLDGVAGTIGMGTVSVGGAIWDDAEWHHIGFVRNAATLRDELYIDGVLGNSAAFDGTTIIGHGLMLGNFPGFDLLGVNGAFDDVRMYSRALSAAEVAELAAGNYASRTGGSALTASSNLTVTNDLSNHNGTFSIGSQVLTAMGATVSNFGSISEGAGGIVHASSSLTASTSITIGASIGVTLTDSDENIDGTARDTVSVLVGGESLTLTETAVASGVFTGSMPTRHGSYVPGNGIIENDANCGFLVTTSYADAQDATDTRSTQTTVNDPNVSCAQDGGGGGGGGGGGLRQAAPVISRSSQSSESDTNEARSSNASSEDNEPSNTTSSSAPLSFPDVPASSWFSDAITMLKDLGIAKGYEDGLFRPANEVTTAEALTLLLRAAKVDLATGPSLNQSAQGTWAEQYIATGESMGLPGLEGDVHAAATRGSVFRLLAGVFNFPLSDASHPFVDLPTSHPAASAIQTLHALGIVKGDDGLGTVRPDGLINRAELSVLLMRLLQDPPSAEELSALTLRPAAAAGDAPTMMTITFPVKVRASASMEALVISQLPAETPVSVLSLSPTWAKIELGDGRVGFVVRKYLR